MSDRPDRKLRIAIGENHGDLAESLSLLIDFQDDMRSVGHAASSRVMLELAAREHPDVVILDLSLDDGSSIPLMRALRSGQPHCALIAFTGHANTVLIEQCLLAGCDRVLTKARPIDELLTAVRGAAAARGAQPAT